MRRPNWVRSRAYPAAHSSAACASPVATAAMPSRPESSAEKAMGRPWPSAPIRASAPISAPAQLATAVGMACRPIFFSGRPNDSPSTAPGARKHETPLAPSAVRANRA